MLIGLVMIIFVGQLEGLTFEMDEESLPFESEDSTFPKTDEIVDDEELTKRSGKLTYTQFL